MGLISDMFSHESPVSVTFQQKTQTFTDGVIGPETWKDLLEVQGLFFTGSQVDRVIGERMRASVDAVILVDYDHITKTIPETARAEVNGYYYSVVYLDNVGMQNELYVIPVKRMNVV